MVKGFHPGYLGSCLHSSSKSIAWAQEFKTSWDNRWEAPSQNKNTNKYLKFTLLVCLFIYFVHMELDLIYVYILRPHLYFVVWKI